VKYSSLPLAWPRHYHATLHLAGNTVLTVTDHMVMSNHMTATHHRIVCNYALVVAKTVHVKNHS
jgi:hypothetical protein